MTATVAEARDAILSTFRTAWLADAATAAFPVQYQDVAAGEFPPRTGSPTAWARVTIIHSPGAGGQSSLSGDTGRRRYTRLGVVTVQLFAPAGDGQKTSDQMVQVAKGAFEGVRTPGTGVVFHRVRPTEIGPDGAYYQVNVLADFEYDEVR